MPSFHISPLWVRDAGGRGASERHRRAGDAPPSPWPPKGLVSGLERLYGPVSRWQRMAIMGPLRSGISQPLRNLCPWPRLRGPGATTQPRYDLVSEATGTAGRLRSGFRDAPLSSLPRPRRRAPSSAAVSLLVRRHGADGLGPGLLLALSSPLARMPRGREAAAEDLPQLLLGRGPRQLQHHGEALRQLGRAGERVHDVDPLGLEELNPPL